MPGGEYTPGMLVQTVGRNVFRLQVYGMAARDLKWTGMDMVYEENNYRLRWFVE
jgi:hypothetical protein